MIPALEAALAQIEDARCNYIRLAQPDPRYPGSAWEHYAAELPRHLADLDRKAEVYRFIADSNAVTDYAERGRLLDAVYVYQRQKVIYELGFVLGNGTDLPTDDFEVARFAWFSVPQWWQEAAGDYSSDLCDTICPPEPAWDDVISWQAEPLGGPRYAPERVCLQPGTIIRRSESVFDGSRSQSFGPNSSSLAMVVRQWVEEPDDVLAVALTKNAEWNRLVSEPCDTYPYTSESHALQDAGLPCTPSVQTFLSQERDKRHDPLTLAWGGLPPTRPPVVPCRGGMVTSFVFVYCGYGNGAITRRVWVVQQTTSAAGWVTDRFWDLARKCSAAHAKWVKGIDLGILTSASFSHGLQGGSLTLYPEAEARIRALVSGDKSLTKLKICADLRAEMERVAGAPVPQLKANKHFANRKSRLLNTQK